MSIDKPVLKTRQGFFSRAEGKNSSNWRELTGVSFTIQSAVADLRGHSVLVETDNTTSAAYINHMGGRHWRLNMVAQALWEFCLQPDQDQGNSSSRGRQCQSRSAEQGEVRPNRVQATSRSVSADQPSVRSSLNRLDGRSAEYSVAEIRLSLSGSSQLRHRCLQEQPGGGERLRTSSPGLSVFRN